MSVNYEGGNKKLPDDLIKAFEEKRKYIEQYARISDLLKDGCLQKYMSSQENSELFSYERDCRTTDAAQQFVKLMLLSHEKSKWDALKRTLQLPGQELLCYILNEADENKLEILEKRKKLVQETFREELLAKLDPFETCQRFKFSEGNREKILCEKDKSGSEAANTLILKYIVKYQDWFPQLVKILKTLGHRILAEKLHAHNTELEESVKDCPAKHTRSSNKPVIPMVDDVDKNARGVRVLVNVGTPDYSDYSFLAKSSDTSAKFGSQLRTSKAERDHTNTLTYDSKKDEASLNCASRNMEGTSSQNQKLLPKHSFSENIPHASKESYSMLRTKHGEALSDSFRNPHILHSKVDSKTTDTSDSVKGIGFHIIKEQRKQGKHEKTPSNQAMPLSASTEDTQNQSTHSLNRLVTLSSHKRNPNDLVERQRYAETQRSQPRPSVPSDILNNSRKQRLPVFRCQHCATPFSSAISRDEHTCNCKSTPPMDPAFSRTDPKTPWNSFEKNIRRQTHLETFRCPHCSLVFTEPAREQHMRDCQPTPPQRLSLNVSDNYTRSTLQRVFRCQHCYAAFLKADICKRHKCPQTSPK